MASRSGRSSGRSASWHHADARGQVVLRRRKLRPQGVALRGDLVDLEQQRRGLERVHLACFGPSPQALGGGVAGDRETGKRLDPCAQGSHSDERSPHIHEQIELRGGDAVAGRRVLLRGQILLRLEPVRQHELESECCGEDQVVPRRGVARTHERSGVRRGSGDRELCVGDACFGAGLQDLGGVGEGERTGLGEVDAVGRVDRLGDRKPLGSQHQRRWHGLRGEAPVVEQLGRGSDLHGLDLVGRGTARRQHGRERDEGRAAERNGQHDELRIRTTRRREAAGGTAPESER
jgi:hypothetical protein